MYTAVDVSGSVIHLGNAWFTRMKQRGNPLDRLYVNYSIHLEDLINTIFIHIKPKYFSFREVTYFLTKSPSLLSKNIKIKIKRNNFCLCLTWIWNLAWHWRRNIGGVCSRTGCWGRYLGLIKTGNRELEKNAQWLASRSVLLTKNYQCNKNQNNKKWYKSTSAQQSTYYYHIGVKVDNMFRLSGSHHQVQYKET